MKRILSGIQPSNTLHIGNYFGAIKQWLIFKNNYECIFFIADLHSLTTNINNNGSLYDKSLEVLATYIACGVDPDNTKFFLQSQVYTHPYFSWILSCLTQLGEINRMVQMKDKSKTHNNVGILTYPILMAADILLYNPIYVPVGQDQHQHLELSRILAKRLNKLMDEDYFNEPQPFMEHHYPIKIYDLTDGTKKMSKTHSAGCLFLNDTDEIITKKIAKAKTDSFPMPLIHEDFSHRPEISNLINIYSCFADESVEEIVKQFSGQNISVFKKHLIEVAIKSIGPIRNKIQELMNDKIFLENLLFKGKQWAIKESLDIIEKINKFVF